jgi:ADP-ribosylglycohydrolase
MDGDDYVTAFHEMVQRFPDAGWGGSFLRWAEQRRTEAYGSYGNGAAMRVSPVGFALATLEETVAKAAESAAVTHDHPEGIRGAQATAAAIFLARADAGKEEIRRGITERFGYDLSRTVDEIRSNYRFNETCQETVPQAITAFLDSTGFEDAIRNAISLGGDADTLAAIAGPIAQAHYGGVPAYLRAWVRERVARDLWEVVERFERRYGVGAGKARGA